MRFVADLLYVLAGLAYLPVALYNAPVVGKNRRGWGQRLGRVPKFDPSGPRSWKHAVAPGEMHATPLLRAAPPPAPARAAADDGNAGCGGRLAGPAPRVPR